MDREMSTPYALLWSMVEVDFTFFIINRHLVKNITNFKNSMNIGI